MHVLVENLFEISPISSSQGTHFFCTVCCPDMVQTLGRCSLCRAEVRWNQFSQVTTNLGEMMEAYQACFDQNGNKIEEVEDENMEGADGGEVSSTSKAKHKHVVSASSSAAGIVITGDHWLAKESCHAELEASNSVVKRLDKFGSKIQTIYSAVKHVLDADPASKIIMFMQFDSMLSLLKEASYVYGYQDVATLSGRASKYLEEFSAKISVDENGLVENEKSKNNHNNVIRILMMRFEDAAGLNYGFTI